MKKHKKPALRCSFRAFLILALIGVFVIGSVAGSLSSYAYDEQNTEDDSGAKAGTEESQEIDAEQQDSDVAGTSDNEETIAEAEEKENHVNMRAAPTGIYIDGTNGGIRFYEGASKYEAESRVFTLPDNNSVSKPRRYDYVLKGWYDVGNNKYYEPGATVDLSKNNERTVFYADWVPADYNIGKDINTVPTADTSSFVTTQLFDYNDLYNLGEMAKPAIRYNLNGTETWRCVLKGQISALGTVANGLIVLDGRQPGNTLLKPGNRPDNGAYVNKESGPKPYSGVITPNLYGNASPFFNDDGSTIGVNYVGTGEGLFQYDNDENSQNYGYYYYDSKKNATAYNREDNRFYVYNYTEKTDAAGDTDDFLPFNYGSPTHTYDCGDGNTAGQTLPDDANYWFGMKTDIDFFLPDASDSVNGHQNNNQAIGNKDMVYRFSGDDDVWILVDGEMVLDLGGIHGVVYGEINFSTGKVTTISSGGIRRETRFDFESGDHHLTMYYMERGASESNCSLYFNIAPRYKLNILKHDADNPSALLENAVFSIYIDEACTVPAALWEDEASCINGEPSKNTFETNANGEINCYGLYANRTYYLKEVSSPSGYPSIADKTFVLSLDKNGVATLGGSGKDLASLTQNNSTKELNLSVSNKKPETTSIDVQKKWYNEDGSPVTEDIPEQIIVHLYRSTFKSEPHSGGTGALIPVNFTTQYFGSSNGSNTDTASLTAGDYSLSKTVTSGGKLSFTLNVTKPEAGIYSVTVNGKTLRPDSTSGRSVTNCYIGGKWGNYPYQNATYTVNPVTENLDIKVTLIGYLGYGGNPHHPDVSYSMDPISVTTTEPSGGGGSGTTPTIPSVKPDDAVEVENALILNDNNHWKDGWDNLPTEDEEGNPYYYYVEEESVPGYTTSYIGNGTINGTVEVINVRQRVIEVKKKWEKPDGSELTLDLPDSIAGVLIQTDETGKTKEIPFTLDAENNWSKIWRNVSIELGEESGHQYSYSVKESSTFGTFTVSYDNNSGISEGMITITNKKKAYTLPSAGGPGTYPLMFIGMFILTIAAGRSILLRKGGE